MSQVQTKLFLVMFMSGCLLILPGVSASTNVIANSSAGAVTSKYSPNNFKLSETTSSNSAQNFVPFTATNHSGPITINGDSQVAPYASSGNGSKTSPYIIQNFNISQASYRLFQIVNTGAYIIIQHCFFNSQDSFLSVGINATNNANLIINNNIIENDFTGIIVADAITFHNTISVQVSNNSISQADDGINVYQSDAVHVDHNSISGASDRPISVLSSTNTVVTDNDCVGFYKGLLVSQSSWSLVENNLLSSSGGVTDLRVDTSSHNTFINDSLQKAGLLLEVTNSDWNDFSNLSFTLGKPASTASPGVIVNGTMISSSNYNTLTNSTFDSSFGYDIVITSGLSNQLTANSFSKTQEFNVFISSGDYNVIEKNSFLALGNYGNSQAYDNGYHDLFLYNFWNGWTGPDNNSDGIVDSPYLIDGSAHTYDTKPLASISELDVLGSPLITTVPKTTTSTQASSTTTNTTSSNSINNFFSSANSSMILAVAGVSMIVGLLIPIIFRKIKK